MFVNYYTGKQEKLRKIKSRLLNILEIHAWRLLLNTQIPTVHVNGNLAALVQEGSVLGF